jgi:hypothetical protein
MMMVTMVVVTSFWQWAGPCTSLGRQQQKQRLQSQPRQQRLTSQLAVRRSRTLPLTVRPSLPALPWPLLLLLLAVLLLATTVTARRWLEVGGGASGSAQLWQTLLMRMRHYQGQQQQQRLVRVVVVLLLLMAQTCRSLTKQTWQQSQTMPCRCVWEGRGALRCAGCLLNRVPGGWVSAHCSLLTAAAAVGHPRTTRTPHRSTASQSSCAAASPSARAASRPRPPPLLPRAPRRRCRCRCWVLVALVLMRLVLTMMRMCRRRRILSGKCGPSRSRPQT